MQNIKISQIFLTKISVPKFKIWLNFCVNAIKAIDKKTNQPWAREGSASHCWLCLWFKQPLVSFPQIQIIAYIRPIIQSTWNQFSNFPQADNLSRLVCCSFIFVFMNHCSCRRWSFVDFKTKGSFLISINLEFKLNKGDCERRATRESF